MLSISPTMKICLTIALISYLVGDSAQFTQQFGPRQISHNQKIHFVGRPQQFIIPAKRQVQLNIPEVSAGVQFGQHMAEVSVGGQSQQPHIPEGGARPQFQQQPPFQQQIQEGGVGGQFQQQQPQFEQQISEGGDGGQFRQQNGGEGVQPQFQQNSIAEVSGQPGCGGFGRPPCTVPDAIPCQGRVDGSGAFSFTCNGRRPVIENKNVLWLETPDINQAVNIDVPNYEIRELIQAGFKGTGTGRTKINVVLQPPSQIVEAQREKAVIKPSTPNVSFRYTPAQGKLIHWQNDRQYQQLTGPIRPPPREGQFNSAPGERENPATFGAQPPPQPQKRFALFPV